MAWITKFFDRNRREREFDRELQFHIDELERSLIAEGIAPEEAHRRAMLEFGGKEQMTQSLRDVHVVSMLERARSNLKAGFRLMRRAPGFSLAVILTLALGIGANSAVFSAIDAVLLRPLPFPHAEELVQVNQLNMTQKKPESFAAPRRIEDWNRMNSTFQAISGYYTEDSSETSGAMPEKITRGFVAPRFLQVWGVSPALGRDFTDEELKSGGPNAVIISDSLWRRRFHGDPEVVGKTLRFGSHSTTIVGVMPASFLFPVREVELWSPVAPDDPITQNRESTWYTGIGRLKPGVKVSQANADMATVQSQLGKQFPKPDADLAVAVQSLKEVTVSGARSSLWMLYGSVTLLLLIACTNIVALLLSRSADREHEIAVRFSLGASRRSIVAQLLTETFVLCAIGSAVGLAVATLAMKVFRTLAAGLPRVEEIGLDWHIAGYSLFCAVVVTLLCGLLPALSATDTLSKAMAQHSRSQVSGRHPMQWTLVGVQVALAVTLLFGAGLLLRSFQILGQVSPGFEAHHVLALHISASWGETVDMKKLMQRIDRTLDTLRGVPGVEGAAITSTLPGVPDSYQTELKITDAPQDTNHKVIANGRYISTGYFSTMQIPMLAGEPCRQSSLENATFIVNRSFADRYFPDGQAIGHHLLVGVGTSYSATGEIKGVAADSREQGLDTEPMPTVYWCINAPGPDPHYLVRTRGEPMAMAETIRRKISEIEPGRAMFDVKPLDEHLSDAYAENRLRTVLLSLFALTAVSLACVGLYGTLSYFVNQRRREIGLRLALGAVRFQIAWRYVRQGLRVALIGCACGLVLAAGSGRLLAGMLYGVSSFDARTVAAVVALMVLVAGVAVLMPAWRASRTDPMRVLREE
jgi:putative ABC transport system permease protein